MINRSKMRRQLYSNGGTTRQHYGLGSLVKKAIKSVTKPIKQIFKSDAGRAALLGAGLYGLGGGTFFGKGFPGMGGGFKMGNILSNIQNLGTMGKAALGTGAAALAFGGGDPTKTEGFDMAKRKGDVESYLRKYYRQYKQSDWQTGWTQDEEDDFVARYTSEYNQGGRVGLYAGSPDPDDMETLSTLEIMSDQGIPYGEQVKKEGIKSLEAGAPDLRRMGNMETEDSQLVEKYMEHKQEADVPMSFDEFEKYQSMTAFGGPFAALRKLGFKSNEISNLFRNLATMGKEYKTNENFKELYRMLANPMENKEAIIGIMQEYGKKIPKVLKEKIKKKKVKKKKTRKKKSIGGIMGARVGLRAMQDLIDDEDEEYAAQGGRVGQMYGTGPAGLPGIPRMASDGMEFDMRAEGGFQPLGAKEGKDDVPAMLAKNEFVFTADAVRGAGDGDIEKGAQRMYDTMKNLEGKIA